MKLQKYWLKNITKFEKVKLVQKISWNKLWCSVSFKMFIWQLNFVDIFSFSGEVDIEGIDGRLYKGLISQKVNMNNLKGNKSIYAHCETWTKSIVTQNCRCTDGVSLWTKIFPDYKCDALLLVDGDILARIALSFWGLFLH